ncbi:mitochondrial carrier [Hysterangium stoloniferum]|nr:mitochondrial carrier [Hysterangium stoloniferum]
MSKTVKDITAGTAGGILQVLVGQPFDIVKVRMQTAPKGTYSGMVHCATGILKNEGPLAFYKGTLSPLLGIGVCVSIQFAVLESTKRYFATQNILKGRGGSDGREFTAPQLVFAGAFAGVANALVSGPVEHIRIRMQTQPSVNPLYAGPWDAIRKISSAHGIGGVFKGQTATFGRDGIGYAAYFWAYEELMQWEMHRKGITRDQVPAPKTVLFGAAAGYALWACIYPIDVIKSRMQTDGFTTETGRKYGTTLDCFKKVLKTEGGAAFTRGLVPTIIRSPFANGATFLGFELASRWLYADSEH